MKKFISKIYNKHYMLIWLMPLVYTVSLWHDGNPAIPLFSFLILLLIAGIAWNKDITQTKEELRKEFGIKIHNLEKRLNEKGLQ